MHKRIPILATLLYLAALALPAAAANLPDYYPRSFDHWGTVNSLDGAGRVLVVDDITIPLAPSVQVYTENTRFATLNDLKPGMKIGFGTTGSRAVQAISEVWVLPADYQPEAREH